MSRLPAEDQRLDGRYVLEEIAHRGAHSTLWRATDQILDRTVAARLIPGQDPAHRAELIARATRAGQVADAHWTRVLDVGSETVGDTTTVWVITEWVGGPTLTAILREHPMAGPAATSLLMACGQAVAAAQLLEATHGGLNPDQILLPTADGDPRLSGLEIGAGVHAAEPYDDVRGLGALLYAALTGRWPLDGWDGLPRPSKGDGIHPRRHRRAVGGEVDAICARALSGDYQSAQAFLDDLSQLPGTATQPAPIASEEPRTPAWRRWAWRIVPPLLVAGIGLVSWHVGREIGRIPPPTQTTTPRVPHASERHTGPQVVWRSPPRVTSFDPPHNVAQDPGSLGLAVDGDPSTEWRTRAIPHATSFGAGSHGIGLLLELRQVRSVRVAELLLSRAGANLQIRAGTKRPTRLSDLPLVTSRPNVAAAVRITLPERVTARYWLIWFTSLPKAGHTHRLGVAEIALLR